jgi:hypothetical protein
VKPPHFERELTTLAEDASHYGYIFAQQRAGFFVAIETFQQICVVVGRTETDWSRRISLSALGNGLSAADHHEDALSVMEAELAIERRIGASEGSILVVQNNLANTYNSLGRLEDALRTTRDVYSGRVKSHGDEHRSTIIATNNYATALLRLQRFEETRSLTRKVMPVARRVLGECDTLTLKMRWSYAMALYSDKGATLDDLREAVETLESVAKSWKRVFGQAHPETPNVQKTLAAAHMALAARAA